MPRERMSMARAAMASVALGATALRREARERLTPRVLAPITRRHRAQLLAFSGEFRRNTRETKGPRAHTVARLTRARRARGDSHASRLLRRVAPLVGCLRRGLVLLVRVDLLGLFDALLEVL